MNLSDKLHVGRELTDRRIDHYTLLGYYGESRQARLWRIILRGKYHGLDARIKAGVYGEERRSMFFAAENARFLASANRAARKQASKAQISRSVDEILSDFM